MTKKVAQTNGWLEAHPEFVSVARRFGRLSSREHRDRLACGAIAERCLKRYDRELNAARFAEYLTQVNDNPVARETVNDYRNAYRMYRLWKVQSGGEPPHLDITKLATAYRAGPAHLSDQDKVTLCERTLANGLTRTRMRNEALRISKERTRAKLTYEVRPRERIVRQIDGLDLLRDCDPQSADVIILDWMYKPLLQRSDDPLPRVHIPNDPAAHVIECIRAAAKALTTHGIIALFADHRGDHDVQILTELQDAGLRRYDQYIHQRMAGGFSQAIGPIFANAHETVDIYRHANVSDFPKRTGYIRSVSPKWHSRNHRASAERAVHPCEKPIEIMLDLIRPVTANGLVVDPFTGSGSAGVAAVQLGCSFRGAELVPEYVEIANKRIALAVDREQETENAINATLADADERERAAIENYLEQAGIELSAKEEAA